MVEISCSTRTAYQLHLSTNCGLERSRISEQRLIWSWIHSLMHTRASEETCLHSQRPGVSWTPRPCPSVCLKHIHTLHQLLAGLMPPGNKTPDHIHLDQLSWPWPPGLPKPVILSLGPPVPCAPPTQTRSQRPWPFRSLWYPLPGFYRLSFRTAGDPG